MMASMNTNLVLWGKEKPPYLCLVGVRHQRILLRPGGKLRLGTRCEVALGRAVLPYCLFTLSAFSLQQNNLSYPVVHMQLQFSVCKNNPVHCFFPYGKGQEFLRNSPPSFDLLGKLAKGKGAEEARWINTARVPAFAKWPRSELDIHHSSKNCVKQTARHWASLLALHHTRAASVIWPFSYYWAGCSYFESHFSFRHLKVVLLLSKQLVQWWNSKTHQGYSHNTKSISGLFLL